MENTIERVLILHDTHYEPCYVTMFDFYADAKEMIGKLRDPHCRIYQFRQVFQEDLETYAEEDAWYCVNTANIPWPFDPARNKFTAAFELLWARGKEVY